jgi:hypothetical protein
MSAADLLVPNPFTVYTPPITPTVFTGTLTGATDTPQAYSLVVSRYPNGIVSLSFPDALFTGTPLDTQTTSFSVTLPSQYCPSAAFNLPMLALDLGVSVSAYVSVTKAGAVSFNLVGEAQFDTAPLGLMAGTVWYVAG